MEIISNTNAMSTCLGDDEAQWREHDASCLLGKLDWKVGMLVDQGSDDPFLNLLLFRALSPFVIANVVWLILMVAFPSIALWLPGILR